MAYVDWAGERSGLLSQSMMVSICRSPAEFLSRYWRRGRVGALVMGLEHGAYCLGCCWSLMALLFVVGIMNVAWIAALAIVVLVEKLLPFGQTIARGFGIGLIGAGLRVAASAL